LCYDGCTVICILQYRKQRNEDTISQDEFDDSKENSFDDEQEVSSFQRTEESTRSRENNRLMFKEAGLTVENIMSMVAGYSLGFLDYQMLHVKV